MRGIYKLFLGVLILSMYSCIDCEKSAQTYRKGNLEVILTERPTVFGDMNFVGTTLNSSEIKTIRIADSWYRDYMEIGDRVIKRRGELVLYIHKKETVMSFKWDCKGKIYE
ncbi:hypothetical protein [Flavobacterium sp. JP2137]|uniref:hypothetical protein n=1 Tax=Flavobacterium sp. JP2137 TaxID=3414510 RepID=UPI003D2FE567